MGGAVERIRERGEDERVKEIVGVLVGAFDELMRADPVAFRRKFRKMAAEPFAFYRGTACLFYSDMAHDHDPWSDERTSRVWIQGDLHAENFGTYMDASGTLVFDVNDFDEAYLGCFTWDLKRLAASVALMAWSKAISDDDIAALVGTYLRSYVRQVRDFAANPGDELVRLQLDSTEGVVHDVLLKARMRTRIDLLDTLTTVSPTTSAGSPAGSACASSTTTSARSCCARSSPIWTPFRQGKRFAGSTYHVKDVVGPLRLRHRVGRACRPTTCWSRAARRRWRTTWCCR